MAVDAEKLVKCAKKTRNFICQCSEIVQRQQ